MNKNRESFGVRQSLYFAWVLSVIGFCLSVFYGEILLHEPCPLCWYQRIALFPLALILGIGAYRDDRGIALYAMPLALIGAALAFFQGLFDYFPGLQTIGMCRLGASCSQTVIRFFGFLDFPILSGLGFCLIVLFLSLAAKKPSHEK